VHTLLRKQFTCASTCVEEDWASHHLRNGGADGGRMYGALIGGQEGGRVLMAAMGFGRQKGEKKEKNDKKMLFKGFFNLLFFPGFLIRTDTHVQVWP
jgi:hypothetical protein